MTLTKGKNITIKENVIIGNNVKIEDDVYIDYGVIIKDNVHIKKGSFIGARCILGEFLGDFFYDKKNKVHPLIIGENAIIRSESIIYGDCEIGDNFQTGHKVTIREESKIGNNVRIGTNSDVQGRCSIGNYSSIHSNCFICELTTIKDYVWIFPGVTITNDPTPPSKHMRGVTIEDYSVICARSVILPGVLINTKAVIGSGSVVTKDVEAEMVVVGNPARVKGYVYDIRNKVTNEISYPWMKNFDRGMPWEGLDYDEWILKK